jgi:DNA-binding NarL/FixJ family response regulator
VHREALALVGEGATNVQIASTFGIGAETVKTLLGRIFVKLGVSAGPGGRPSPTSAHSLSLVEPR